MTAAPQIDQVTISSFRSNRDSAPRGATVAWAKLVEALRKVRQTACTVATCKRGSDCVHKAGAAWSPATYPPRAPRKKIYVEAISLLVVDIDHVSDEQLAAAKAPLAPYQRLFHSSHSDRPPGCAICTCGSEPGALHGERCPSRVDRCVRAVLALSRSVTRDEHPRFWPAAMAHLKQPADPSCCDANRLYYLPSRPMDAEYLFEVYDGIPVDVDAILATAPPAAPTIADNLKVDDDGVVEPGQRHAMLTSLAGAMRYRGALLDEIDPALHAANRARCKPPKSDAEVSAIALWAAAQPMSSLPRPAHDHTSKGAHAVGGAAVVGDRSHAGLGPKGGYRTTDLGNAKRFADAHHDRLRYVPARDEWRAWDGRRWHRDELCGAEAAAKQVVAAIYMDAARCAASAAANGDGDDAAKALAKWAHDSSKRARIDAMVALARSEPEIATRPDVFDRDPFLFNAANGTIDLRTGKLRPHRPSDMITMLADVEYDENAQAPEWERFLGEMLPDDGVRGWINRHTGSALTGDMRDQEFPFYVGKGGNGKNVYADAVCATLGDYAMVGAPDLLLQKKSDTHPTELADLEGKRLVICSEIEPGRSWNEARIKQITGDKRLKARHMREDFYEFDSTAKLIVLANTKPKVRSTDDGIWRRLKLVPWTVQIPKPRRDKQLLSRLIANERPGILASLVRGCLAWQRDGLGTADSIEAATADYRSAQDVLGNWISDSCVLHENAWTKTADVYADYAAWCSRTSREPWTRDTLRERLLERSGITAVDRGVGRGLLGIGLRAAERSRPSPQATAPWTEILPEDVGHHRRGGGPC